MDIVSAFRHRLREAIDRRGISQTSLARELEVRDATVSDWLTGRRMPSGVIFLRLPELLEVDGHWLLTGEQPRRNGDWMDGLTEDDRDQVVSLVGAALGVLRERQPEPAPVDFLRIRAPGAGERPVLEARGVRLRPGRRVAAGREG
ncbi:MAG TPA: helix-turn-helix transcriptional regulator [Longimicrobiaceae bacterium]|jgi:transcriptional regulator with XRE-family HTH domain|nr:helix-turn-helix transcriptional regulator [Longimicrobiaceae bacterium]